MPKSDRNTHEAFDAKGRALKDAKIPIDPLTPEDLDDDLGFAKPG